MRYTSKALILGLGLLCGVFSKNYKVAVLNDIHIDLNYNPTYCEL